jgi:hypothetical protein
MMTGDLHDQVVMVQATVTADSHEAFVNICKIVINLSLREIELQEEIVMQAKIVTQGGTVMMIATRDRLNGTTTMTTERKTKTSKFAMRNRLKSRSCSKLVVQANTFHPTS